jgi:hypothetical protein
VPVVGYVEHVAQERFEDGYTLREMLTVLQVLEETTRRHLIAALAPTANTDAQTLLNAVFSACKEALTSTYTTLESEHKARPLRHDVPVHSEVFE